VTEEAAVAAVEAADRQEVDTVCLSNGITLKIKGVPPYLIRQAAMRIERPPPPKIQIREGVEEENPDDSEYKTALRQYEKESAEAGTDVMLLGGLDVADLPDGCVGPESDDWLDLVEYVGEKVDRDSKYARKLAWLKFYAIASERDMLQLIAALGSKIGLREGEVTDAVDSFRGGKVGGADNGLPAAPAGDRDNVPPNREGRRARSRGKGSR